jgi:hypothetical protein
LVRRPVLLFFIAAVAVFGEAERTIGLQTALWTTAHGRDLVDGRYAGHDQGLEWRYMWLSERFPSILRQSFSPRNAAVSFAAPVDMPVFKGFASLLYAAAQGDRHPATRQEPWQGLLPDLVRVLLGMPLAAALLSGYYGLLGRAAAGRHPRWRDLGSSIPRCFARFLVFVLLVFAVSRGADYARGAIGRAGWSPEAAVWRFQAALGAVHWLPGVLGFLFMLTLVVVVTDNASLVTAARRSVVTVIRRPGVALGLLALLAVARGIVLAANDAAVMMAWNSRISVAVADVISQAMIGASIYIVRAVIGVWILLALFLWYREERCMETYRGGVDAGSLPYR